MAALGKIFKVYVIYRADGKTPFYVGKGKGRRETHHARGSHNIHLRRAYAKYGELPIEIWMDDLTDNQACKLERTLIKRFGRADLGEGTLCNNTDGGDGKKGYVTPLAQRCKQSRVMKGRKASNLTRQRMRASAPKTKSASHRAAISRALKGKKKSLEHRAAMRGPRSATSKKVKAYYASLTTKQKRERAELIAKRTKAAMARKEVRDRVLEIAKTAHLNRTRIAGRFA